jgi:hypothetical protein
MGVRKRSMPMRSISKVRVTCRNQGWNGLVGVLVLMLLFGTPVLTAQSLEQEEKSKPFIGNWGPSIGRGTTRAGSEERGNCGGRLGDFGEKINNCGIPVDQLPLNKRGEAWLVFADHAASPAQSECANLNIPSVSGSGVVISAFLDKLVLQHPDPMSVIPREVWMDGRGHPPSKYLWQQGHSIGRWDGDDLVVETTNFTFDPDGIDDHLHMASSVRKKVTERYQAIDKDHLRLIITLEDPVFLTRPFKFSFALTREAGGIRPSWNNCDPDAARREIEYSYPGEKYKE